MIFIDDKERERLTVAVTAGLALHFVAFIVFGYINLSPEPATRYEKMVLIELEDSTAARPRVRTDPVESAVREQPVKVPPAAVERQEPAETIPEKSATRQEQPASETAVAKVDRSRPKQAVNTAKSAQIPTKSPVPVKTSEPDTVSSTAQVADVPRLVPDPSEAPDRIVPVRDAVVPKQTGVQSALPKPDVKIPDWATQAATDPPRTSERAVAAGTVADSPAGGAGAKSASALDLSKLDSTLASAGRTQQSGAAGVQKVGVPSATPSQAAGAGSGSPSRSPITNTIEWKDPTEGRTVQYRVEPKMPAWVERDGLRFEVLASLDVIPEGTVSNVSIVKSSGYPEVDAIITEALRRWRFLPVPNGRTAHGNLKLNVEPDVR